MKPSCKLRFLAVLALALGFGSGGDASFCFAQTSGNIGYSQGSAKARAEAKEMEKRAVPPAQTPPGENGVFVEASVLMNVRADAFVAVFGVSEEGATVAECQAKMNATLRAFSAALKRLGLEGDAVDIDFVAQNKIYGYEISDTLAREKLTGFELKKNVAIHYKSKALLDSLVAAAAQSQIFDLIKVDYQVANPALAKKRIREEAGRIIKEKIADYATLFEVKLSPPSQVYADKASVYYPSELYDSYTAYEAEAIERSFDRSKLTVQNARKSRTFFFNPLGEDGFDVVINPVVLEPVVQYTLYIKVKCEVRKGER